jgi:glycosyltransferase involved in cell wall biosynthesis
MRRIVYIHNIMMPGPEANTVQVAKMCSAFAGLGHNVTLMALPDANDEDYSHRLLTHYGVKHRFSVLPLSSFGGRPSIAALNGALSARNRRPDILYTRTPHVALATCMAGIPTLFEIHTDVDAFSGLGRFCFEKLLNNPALLGIVAISDPLARHLHQAYPTLAHPIIVAHDGADEPTPNASPTKPMRFSVGYVGSLYEGKGVELVVEIARLCRWADFHIVGGSPNERLNIIARWRPPPNVHFRGRIAHAEVENALVGFDALLAPYQERVLAADGRTNTARWMSPLKIFEYMAAGSPIVASRIPAIEDLLKHDHTALLCAPTKPGEWAQALRRLSTDRELAGRLGGAARQILIDKHTWERRAAYILDTLQVQRTLSAAA